MATGTERKLERAIKSLDRLGPRLQLCGPVKTLRNVPALVARLLLLAIVSVGATLATSVVNHSIRPLSFALALLAPALGGFDGRRTVEVNDLGVTWTNLCKQFVAWSDVGRIEYRHGRVMLCRLVGTPVSLGALTSRLPGPGRAIAAQYAAILSEECARARARGVLGAIG
jgi:hypothetical protein